MVRSYAGIANDDWFIIGGGDGFVALADPDNPRIMYAKSQNGRMNRVDRVTNERQSIRPEPEEDEPKLRWNWDTPMLLSPHDSATVLVAANKVFRSRDRGHLWAAISPELTTNVDRDELELMGVYGKDVTIAKHDGIAHFPTLVTFAESEIREGLYWAGSDDGLAHVSSDAGANWSDVTKNVPGLPAGANVSRLAPSRFESNRVYATFDAHRVNDFGIYVFTSDDLGESWRSLGSNLPAGEIARTMMEDLKNPDVLYLGTERGLYVTVDRGREWHRVNANLPTVPIYEIALHPRENDMILATHGRSIWILDDLTPFQDYAKAAETDAHVFATAPATQHTPAGNRIPEFGGDRRFFGKNPEAGMLTYRLRSDVEEATIEIRDSNRTVVTEIEAMTSAGIHQVGWDLRFAPLPEVKGQPDRRGWGARYDSPFVSPGIYRAHLVVDGKDGASAEIEVSQDPDVPLTAADRRVYDEAARRAYELNRRANEAANTVVDLNE